jgi:alkylation response protein AidB-like acyl-CoA dehydrogenase
LLPSFDGMMAHSENVTQRTGRGDPTEERAMSVELSQDQREFGEYARRWLRENAPPPPPERLPITPIEVMTIGQRDYLQAWQRKCYDAGLVGADYPREYGGRGHKGFQRIANQEMNRAGVPFLINIVGLSMAAPTILQHGTEEQKRTFIPGCLSGDEIWCQGFSEPGAGSDLANQRTSAVRDGDGWIVNGHKVWTSLGHFAKWMILVTRTSKDHKYDGLTYFLCPIEGHPGVTVRPLVKITGETGFNEVFFENVRIPDANRLDDVGKGWAVAMTTLLAERGASEGAGSASFGENEKVIEQLIDLARSSWRNGVLAADDPLARDAIMQRAIVAEGIRQNARRARVPALCEHPLRLPLQQKLTITESDQKIARLGVEIAGAHATLYKRDPRAPQAGHWPLTYLNSYGNTIAAGTNEIQRNILGERVLGLPKTK